MRIPDLVLMTSFLAVLVSLAPGTADLARGGEPAPRRLQAVPTADVPFQHSTPRTKAQASWVLYGKPGTLEGRFEDAVGNPDLGGWTSADLSPGGLVGDFTKVGGGLADIDPCADNATPQLHFIDDGTPPNNHPAMSTGGCTSAAYPYAGFVVNYKGGLSTAGLPLHNEAYSPVIFWDDLSTPADDGIQGGATLRYDIWDHMPLALGVFHTWSVRSWPDPTTGGWSEWRNRDFVYYSEEAVYRTREVEVGDLLVQSPTRLQIALGVVQLDAEFGLPGGDATPSPWFDNVQLVKHDVDGPFISVREMDRFHDAFAASGAALDTMDRAAQAVRIDMAQNVNALGTSIVTGDSMVSRITATLPGTSLGGAPTLTWVLRTNAFFDGVRQIPSGATQLRPDLWRGTVAGDSARVNGQAVADLWAFDLPDGPARPLVAEPIEPPLFFPGDLLWVFLEAEDNLGNITVWPADPDTTQYPTSDTCGGGVGAKPQPSGSSGGDPPPSGGLPPVWDNGEGKRALIRARILVWNDAGGTGELDLLQLALDQLGVLEGRDYDVYSTREPAAALSNGLGGSGGHGATAIQLQDYETILYLGGNAAVPLISDGSGALGNDKGDDIALLNAWRGQPANRHMVYFADNTASAMVGAGPVPASYVSSTQGVTFVAGDVRPALGGLTAPRVRPTSATPHFTAEFVVFGGCSPLRRFDHILPRAAAVGSHEFLDTGGAPFSSAAAGVWWDRLKTVGASTVRRVDATFSYALSQIQDVREPAARGDELTARARLLGEILTALGHSVSAPDATAADVPQVALQVGEVFPNPFNPHMTLSLSATTPQTVRVRVFDSRGRYVATLHDGVVGAGAFTVEWNGRGADGSPAASGVYLVKVEGAQETEIRKALLLK